MAIDTQIARLTPALCDEIDAITKSYYAETVGGEGMPPVCMDWQLYLTIQDIGRMLIVTSREEDGTLLGAAMYIVSRHLHHDMIAGDCDFIVVSHLARSRGIGSALYKVAEIALKERGVQRVCQHQRHIYGASSLFLKHGFRAEETLYVKDI